MPTAQGYRFYVENLLKNIKATNGELEEVRRLIENRTQSFKKEHDLIEADSISLREVLFLEKALNLKHMKKIKKR